MNAERYDLIVLGSGSAARDGAGKAAREYGARVALIEHRLWGGSCPNVACRPTKAYVVAAELMHDVRQHAAERGIDLPNPTLDLAHTRTWKDSLRRDQQSWVQVLTEAGYGVVPGTASFVDAQTVRVGERELSGDRILIATGSRTAVPPIPGSRTSTGSTTSARSSSKRCRSRCSSSAQVPSGSSSRRSSPASARA